MLLPPPALASAGPSTAVEPAHSTRSDQANGGTVCLACACARHPQHHQTGTTHNPCPRTCTSHCTHMRPVPVDACCSFGHGHECFPAQAEHPTHGGTWRHFMPDHPSHLVSVMLDCSLSGKSATYQLTIDLAGGIPEVIHRLPVCNNCQTCLPDQDLTDQYILCWTNGTYQHHRSLVSLHNGSSTT